MSQGAIGEIALDLVVNSQKYKSQMAGIQNMAKKAGLALAAAFSVKGITDFTKQSLELGSDLQEVQNVVDVTFPSMKEKVNEFAQSAAQSFGLSETMAKKYTGTFGAMSKAFGFGEREAYEMGSTLTKLSGDVASFYNITQDEAYTKLKSVFTGETETLKDLGVVMTQAALDAYALENGFGKTTNSMSEAEKVALRYQFVQEKLSVASGDFVRTSGGWANQIRVLTLQFDSLKATLGQGFINLFTPIIKGINGVIGKLQTLANAFKSFTAYITGNDTEESTSGISSGLSEATDAANSLESATSGVGDAAKKAAKELKGVMSYDEVNNISGSSDEASGTSGTSGTSGESIDFGNINADDEKLADKFDAITGKTKVFFDRIKKIVEDFKAGDYFHAGRDTSELVTGIFNSFADAIDNVEWEKLGKSIGEYLAGINWKDVIIAGFKLKFNIWKAIAEVWFGSFKAAPIETAVITAIGALKFTGLGKKIAPALGKAIMGSSLVTSMTSAWASLGGIGGILTMDVATVIGAGTAAEIGTMLATGIIGGIVAAFAGWNIGQEIYTKISGEIIDMSFGEQMAYLWDSILKGDFFPAAGKLLAEGLKGIFNWNETLDLFSMAKESFGMAAEAFREQDWGSIATNILEGIVLGFTGILDFFVEPINDLFKAVWDGICSIFGIHSPATEMEPIGENILLGVIEGFRGKFSEFGDAMSEWWDKKVKPWFSKDKWVEGMSGIKDAFREIFKNACNAAAEKFNKLITWLNEKLNISWEGFSVAGKEIIPAGSVQLVNIPEIPMLANGGYVRANTPQLAIIGDNRHYGEITAPEDKMEAMAKQAALEALKNRGSDNNADNPQPVTVKVYLEGDSKKIFRVVRTENEAYRQQTGHPAFV